MVEAKSRFIDELELAVSRAEAACSEFRFDRRVFRHQLIVGYALWIIESASSISILLRHGRVPDSKTLLRAMLECYVDLELINQDNAHIWNIQYDFCGRMMRQLEQARSGNPFANAIATGVDVEKELSEWAKKRSEVYARGGRTIPIEQKFVRLGLKNDYEMVYRSLSQSAHSTFAGIVARCFAVDAKKQDFKAVLYRSPDPESMDATLDTAISLVDHCTTLAAKMLS